jgi:hypothetical protein
MAGNVAAGDLRASAPVRARDPLALLADAAVAGAAGAALSGVPSTLLVLARGGDPLDGARAAGTLLLPSERRTAPLLAAGTAAHLGISFGWALVLAAVLPRGRELPAGIAAGLAIAALDLGVIGRRLPAIRALPQADQWADHAAYGAVVGWTLARRRSPRPRVSSSVR